MSEEAKFVRDRNRVIGNYRRQRPLGNFHYNIPFGLGLSAIAVVMLIYGFGDTTAYRNSPSPWTIFGILLGVTGQIQLLVGISVALANLRAFFAIHRITVEGEKIEYDEL